MLAAAGDRPARRRAVERAARREQDLEVEVHRPVHDDEHGERRCHRHCEDRGVAAPGDDRGGGRQHEQRDQRGVGVRRQHHECEGGDEIACQHAGGDRAHLAARFGRPIDQPGHQEDGRECEARQSGERVRVQRSGTQIVHADERPQDREHCRGDREPPPHPVARECIGRRGDHGEIDIERPVARLRRAHEQRRHIGADQPETAERGAVLERGRERSKRHQPEQQKGHGGREEFVDFIGRPDVGIGDGGAGRGQNAWDVRARHLVDVGCVFLATRQLAETDQ